LGELLFNASGRLGRILFVACAAGLTLVLWAYDHLLGRWGHLLLGWAVHPVLFVAGVCIVAKRLHDGGRSGWWAALVLWAFCLAWPVVETGRPGVLGFIAGAVLLWAAIVLVLWPGQAGFNRFGAPAGRVAR
jgi:uncharacterized membrane protein YhaH (DUF805 family)